LRQFARQVLEAGVADEIYPVAQLFAPGRDDLRHDAGEIAVHDACVEGARPCLVNQIDNTDTEFSQGVLPIPRSLAVATGEGASTTLSIPTAGIGRVGDPGRAQSCDGCGPREGRARPG